MLGVKQPTAEVAAILLKYGVAAQHFCYARFLKLSRWVEDCLNILFNLLSFSHIWYYFRGRIGRKLVRRADIKMFDRALLKGEFLSLCYSFPCLIYVL